MLGLLHRSTKHALRLSIAYAHEPTQNALRAEDTRIKRRAVSRDSQGQTRLALRPEDTQSKNNEEIFRSGGLKSIMNLMQILVARLYNQNIHTRKRIKNAR